MSEGLLVNVLLERVGPAGTIGTLQSLWDAERDECVNTQSEGTISLLAMGVSQFHQR
jgi:hypothetical protein